MSSLAVIIIVLLVIIIAGGTYGYGYRGWGPSIGYGGGLIGVVLVVLLVLLLIGRL